MPYKITVGCISAGSFDFTITVRTAFATLQSVEVGFTAITLLADHIGQTATLTRDSVAVLCRVVLGAINVTVACYN